MISCICSIFAVLLYGKSMKNHLIILALCSSVSACGGGGSDPAPAPVVASNGNIVDSNPSSTSFSLDTVCDQNFFDNVAGTRTGVLTEIDAASACLWEITLRLERGGSYPLCKQTGTFDFAGTQTNSDSDFTCGNAQGVVASLFTAEAAIEALSTQTEIAAPQTMLFEYETATLPSGTASGVRYRYPFGSVGGEVFLDENFNLTYSGAEGVLTRQ